MASNDNRTIDVLVIGSCMTDLNAYVEKLPKVGETLHGLKFTTGFGGKGANQCVAAKKLGARSALVAKLGNDSFGENYSKNLKNLEIDATFVKVVPNASGVAQICIDQKGNNTIVIVAGANNDLSPQDVVDAEEYIRKAKVVLFQFEIPLETTFKALEICSKYDCIAIVNAAPAISNLDPRIFGLADIFCVNESEAELITNCEIKDVISDAKNAAMVLKSMGCKLPIVTIGDKGAIFIPKDENSPIHIPIDAVDVVDTTGAGDAFIGAMAFFMSKFDQLSIREIIRRSCHVATYSVQKFGTQASFPLKENLPQSLFEYEN